MSLFRSRSTRLDLLLAAVLVLGAFEVFRLPTAARVGLGIAFFFGIGRAALRLARHLIPNEDRATTLTATIVVLVACWTVTATVLGHFGVLTPRSAYVAAALALLATSACAPRGSSQSKTNPEEQEPLERVILLVAFAFFAASLAFEIFLQRNTPPGAQGYDDTSYHLSAVATWHQWHDLRSVKLPVGDGSTTFYPIVGELFSLLLLAPLGDIDFLARWSEVPFALASLAALASIGRILSLRASAAGIAVLLYAASPRVFPSGMLGAGNDHAMGFFILSSVCGALLLRRGPDMRPAILLGASLGLVIGTKYTGPMFLPVLLLMAGACAASWLRPGPSSSWRGRLLAIVGGALSTVATMLCVGGYTYLRNAVGTDNPVFPATLSIGSHRLFQGWAADTIAGFWVRGRSDLDPIHFLWDRVDLFGPLFRWILLPATVLALLLAAFLFAFARSRLWGSSHQSRPKVEFAEIILLGLPMALYLAFVYLMVDHRDIRYVYAGVALAGISVAWLLARLPPSVSRPGRRAVLLAALATLVASQYAAGGTLRVLAVGAIGASAIAIHAMWRRLSRFRPRVVKVARSLPAMAALLGLASVGGGVLVDTYLLRKLETAPAASFLDRVALPGSAVGFCGGNQPYLYFGRRLQNRLLYVPTYGGPPAGGGLAPPLGASFFTWKGPLEFPRHLADRKEWLENLRHLGVGFLVVVRSGEELPERDWIAIEPESFQRVFADSRTEVFAVRGGHSRTNRLRVDFAHPEAEYFLSGSWPREGDDARRRMSLQVPREGGDLMIPPLDGTAVSLTFEGDNLVGDGPGLRLSLNGRPVEVLGSDARRLTYRFAEGAWRAGRNRLSLAPAAPSEDVVARIASIELALDASSPPAQPGSGDLPGNVDVPSEGSPVQGGVLTVRGWCRERGGGRIDPVRFSVNGRDLTPLRLAQTDRPDVVAVLPYILEAKGTGFEADLDVSWLPPGDHSLVVDVETPDGRRRVFPARVFRVLK